MNFSVLSLCGIVLALEFPLLVAVIILFIDKSVYTLLIIEKTYMIRLLNGSLFYIFWCILGSSFYITEFNWFVESGKIYFELFSVFLTIILVYIIIHFFYINIFKIFTNNVLQNIEELTNIYEMKMKKKRELLNSVLDLQYMVFKILLFDQKIDVEKKIKIIKNIYNMNSVIVQFLNETETKKFLSAYKEYTYNIIHDGMDFYSEIREENYYFVKKSISGSNQYCLYYWEENINEIKNVCGLHHYTSKELEKLISLRFAVFNTHIALGNKKSKLLDEIDEYISYNILTDRSNHRINNILAELGNIQQNQQLLVPADMKKYIEVLKSKLESIENDRSIPFFQEALKNAGLLLN